MYSRILATETPKESPKFLTVASVLEAIVLFWMGRALITSVLLGLVSNPLPKPKMAMHARIGITSGERIAKPGPNRPRGHDQHAELAFPYLHILLRGTKRVALRFIGIYDEQRRGAFITVLFQLDEEYAHGAVLY